MQPASSSFQHTRVHFAKIDEGLHVAALVRKRAILPNDNVVLLSSRLPFAYFLLLLKVKCAINTMAPHKVSAPSCIRTVKATRDAIHHWNDSFEIPAQCIDKWFSLAYKTGTKNRNKKNRTLHFFSFFSVLAWHQNQPVVLWFVALAGRHEVMKFLALLMHLVKKQCLMPELVWCFSVVLSALWFPPGWADTLATQPAPGDELNSRTEDFSGREPLVEK